VHEDLLQRDFTISEPNRVWVADMTQHRTDEGWLYLAAVLDAGDRMVVGWSMSERATTELVVDAVSQAVRRRQPNAGVIHHSDRGSQGGFNRSSQRAFGGAYGTTEGLGFIDDWAAGDAFTGAPWPLSEC
jgi:transposase InsO family protein